MVMPSPAGQLNQVHTTGVGLYAPHLGQKRPVSDYGPQFPCMSEVGLVSSGES